MARLRNASAATRELGERRTFRLRAIGCWDTAPYVGREPADDRGFVEPLLLAKAIARRRAAITRTAQEAADKALRLMARKDRRPRVVREDADANLKTLLLKARADGRLRAAREAAAVAIAGGAVGGAGAATASALRASDSSADHDRVGSAGRRLPVVVEETRKVCWVFVSGLSFSYRLECLSESYP